MFGYRVLRAERRCVELPQWFHDISAEERQGHLARLCRLAEVDVSLESTGCDMRTCGKKRKRELTANRAATKAKDLRMTMLNRGREACLVRRCARADADYLDHTQRGLITPNFRRSLAQWLLETGTEYWSICSEICAGGMSIFDRFLSRKREERRRLVCLLLASVHIAMKVRGVPPLAVESLTKTAKEALCEKVSEYIVDSTAIRAAELEILATIDWNTTALTPHEVVRLLTFVIRLSHADDLAAYVLEDALYLCDYAMTDYGVLKYPTTVVGATCMQAALNVHCAGRPGLPPAFLLALSHQRGEAIPKLLLELFASRLAADVNRAVQQHQTSKYVMLT